MQSKQHPPTPTNSEIQAHCRPCLSHARGLRVPSRALLRAGVVCSLLAVGALTCPPAHASIGDAFAASLREVAPDWVVVTVLASLPVVELRGAIPIGIAVLGLHPALVYLCAVLGNTLIVPLILLSLTPLLNAAEKIPALYRAVEGLLQRARKQTTNWDSGDVFWALAYFVAVPLPGTGAWSGSFIAFVLGMPMMAGVLANFAGVCCAGVLVTALVCMGWAGLWIAITLLLAAPLIGFLTRSMSKDPK
jgi:uncharacterized membrane protein